MHRSRYDQPLRKLREARDQLRQDYRRVRHELLRLEKMIAQLETMSHELPPAPAVPGVPHVPDHVSATDIEGLSHADAATLVLSRAGAPLTIRQILDVLERAGRTFSAKNGYGILHRSLRNHRQFDSVAGRWHLVTNGHEVDTLELHHQ